MRAAELALLLEESGNPEAFGAYASYVGREYATLDGFAEAFCGVYESEADYAQELAEECGLVDGDAQQWPLYCIDWERAWRELDMGGDNYSIPTGNGDFYIFRGA
jgi:antirestriction protein